MLSDRDRAALVKMAADGLASSEDIRALGTAMLSFDARLRELDRSRYSMLDRVAQFETRVRSLLAHTPFRNPERCVGCGARRDHCDAEHAEHGRKCCSRCDHRITFPTGEVL